MLLIIDVALWVIDCFRDKHSGVMDCWIVLCLFGCFVCSVSGHECRKVEVHLDCSTATYITLMDDSIETVIVGDELIPTEYLKYREKLSRIRVIVRGRQNCFMVCDVTMSSWIHSCICKEVCIIYIVMVKPL